MKKIIENNNLPDYSDVIEEALSSSEPGTEIEFEPGEYYIGRYINVNNKENININGGNALFITCFDPIDVDKTAGIFIFRCCRNIVVKNMQCDTDHKINATAYITKKDAENLTYEMKLLDDFSMNNGEIMEIVESFDDNLVPDYVLTHYSPEAEYENIGDNTLRVKVTEKHRKEIEKAKIGHKMTIRHSALNRPMMHFHGCCNVTIENIRIYSTNNFIVVDVCENFTVRNICIKAHEGSKLLMNTVRDGIWINGMRGKFVMEDCYFEKLGDDALNVHSKGKKVCAIGGNVIKFTDTVTPIGFDENVNMAAWARPGDVLDIHDAKTFEKKCSLAVKEYKCGEIIFDGCADNVQPGDVICNTAFYCSVTVRNTVAKNSRARGFLIQTQNVLIENCEIADIALAAVLIAPDMKIWYELGPSSNVTFVNNKIKNCCNDHGFISNGIICIQRAHDAPDMVSDNLIHKNIVFKNNTFIDCPVSILHVEGTDGFIFKDNIIEKCEFDPVNDKQRKEKPFNVYGCKNVEISGNTLNGKKI